MTKSEASNGWSEYWQNESADGEVFVGADGSAHPALAAFWLEVLSSLRADSRVLDIASGAGSIYRNLPAGHELKLYATDIAEEALQALERRVEGVTTTVSGAESLPYEDGSFDLVVSQYGVEYAGFEALFEAARLVRVNGRLVLIAHIVDGYIDSSNRRQLEAAEVAEASQFIPLGISLSQTAFGGSRVALETRESEFIPAIQALGKAVQSCPQGVHAHLLHGFRQLYENRQQYDEIDLTGWLEAMQGEVDKAIDRLSRMRRAALDDEQIETLKTRLAGAGFADIDAAVFNTPGNAKPIAWKIMARRCSAS